MNAIIDGMVTAIREEFGDGVSIYDEDIPQGLDPPCFYVRDVGTSDEMVRGRMFLKSGTYAVHYWPSSDEPRRECMDIRERLFHCLGMIDTAFGKSLASDMSAVTEEFMTVTVAYNKYVIRPAPDDSELMEVLNRKEKVRDNGC